MSAIQVKNVPPELHEALRRRAVEEGLDLRDFVLDVLRRELDMPSQRAWLDTLRSQPTAFGLPTAADLLHEARAEQDVDAGRR